MLVSESVKLLCTLEMVYFFTACNGLCDGDTISSGRCFGIDAEDCCHVYVNGMCSDACPDDGVYSVDEDFDCCKLYSSLLFTLLTISLSPFSLLISHLQ